MRGWVATIVRGPEPVSAPDAEIAIAPPAIATTSATSEGQIQSPGYQPRRLRQAVPSAALTPTRRWMRAPHSRQYSWPTICGRPQAGHVGAGGVAASSAI